MNPTHRRALKGTTHTHYKKKRSRQMKKHSNRIRLFGIVFAAGALGVIYIGATVLVLTGKVSSDGSALEGGGSKKKGDDPGNNFVPARLRDPAFTGSEWWLKHGSFRGFPVNSTSDLPQRTRSFVRSTRVDGSNGVIVLGMHRSGTSLLSGLLVKAAGMDAGPDWAMIQPSDDNPRGFYENIDAVVHNDNIMQLQGSAYHDVASFSPMRGAIDLLEAGGSERLSGRGDYVPEVVGFRSHRKPFNAKPTERFLENVVRKSEGPWLQKDPRMCACLPSWFPLFSSPPSVVFTFRSPIDVAMSMKKRDPYFSVERGLRLWLDYNRRAFEGFQGLCTVFTSQRRVSSDPVGEVSRIKSELSSRCGIAMPGGEISKDAVEGFVDLSLIHHKQTNASGHKDDEASNMAGVRGCKFPKFKSSRNLKKRRKEEEKLYAEAMQVHCDMETGYLMSNFEGYRWPGADGGGGGASTVN